MAGALTPDWSRRAVALAAAAVALAWTTPFSQVAIIAGGAVIGRLLLAPPPAPVVGPEPSPVSRRVGIVALGAFAVLLLGLPLLRGPGGQAVALFDGFYRAGALVFGGGHVVLPLLQTTVVDPGWVSDDRFLAGYGLAQAVPGPLFTFAAYLGAVSIPMPNGVPGATIALVAIFLPGLLLRLGGPAVLGLAPDVGRHPAGPDRDERRGRRDPAGGALHARLDERDHGSGRRRRRGGRARAAPDRTGPAHRRRRPVRTRRTGSWIGLTYGRSPAANVAIRSV